MTQSDKFFKYFKDTPIKDLARANPGPNLDQGPCPCNEVNVQDHSDGTATCVTEPCLYEDEFTEKDS